MGQVAGLKLLKKVPILGERDNALRWLRRWRERTIDSAAPLPVDPFEELIHVACEAQEHVVLFEPERTPPTLVSGLRPKPDETVTSSGWAAAYDLDRSRHAEQLPALRRLRSSAQQSPLESWAIRHRRSAERPWLKSAELLQPRRRPFELLATSRSYLHE